MIVMTFMQVCWTLEPAARRTHDPLRWLSETQRWRAAALTTPPGSPVPVSNQQTVRSILRQHGTAASHIATAILLADERPASGPADRCRLSASLPDRPRGASTRRPITRIGRAHV